MSFSSSLQRGWLITKISFSFMNAHKKAFQFPLFALALRIPLLFFGIIVLVIQTHTQSPHAAFGIISTVLLWFITDRFIACFFKTALSAYIAGIVTHQPLGTRQALKKIAHRWPTIFAFGLLNSFLQLKFSRHRSHKSFIRTGSSLMSSLIGFAWRAGTFFMIPIMALETTGIFASIKLSAQTLKKTWGESASGTFSIGGLSFLFGFIYFPALSIFASLVGGISSFLALLVTVIGITSYLIGATIIINVANTVFRTILYLYATHGITGPFDKKFLETSFTKN